MILMLGVNIRRKAPAGILLLVLSGMIGGVILGNTPAVMRNTRLNRKCYDELARTAWKLIGERPLSILGGDESIRGAMPFYGNRQVDVMLSNAVLMERIVRQDSQALMLTAEDFNRLLAVPEFSSSLNAYRIEQLDFPDKADSFVLLLSKTGQ